MVEGDAVVFPAEGWAQERMLHCLADVAMNHVELEEPEQPDPNDSARAATALGVGRHHTHTRLLQQP